MSDATSANWSPVDRPSSGSLPHDTVIPYEEGMPLLSVLALFQSLLHNQYRIPINRVLM